MQRLGDILRKWRIMEEKGTREVALDIGVSASTLNSLERGETPDCETLKRVICWLFEYDSKSTSEKEVKSSA